MGTADFIGTTAMTGWDAVRSLGGSAVHQNRLGRRWQTFSNNVQALGYLSARISMDHDYSFRMGLAGAAYGAARDRWGSGGPMGAYYAASDITGVVTSVIPGANVGKAGQVARVTGAITDVAGTARTATYARGSAQREYLLSQIRPANGRAERQGIVFGHREAARLGYEPVLTSLQYGGGHGLDQVFRHTETGRFAIFEFKGGASQRSLSSLTRTDDGPQGSLSYIESRLGRYEISPGYDLALVDESNAAVFNRELDSFATFSGSRRTYQLPMDGQRIRDPLLWWEHGIER